MRKGDGLVLVPLSQLLFLHNVHTPILTVIKQRVTERGNGGKNQGRLGDDRFLLWNMEGVV